MKLQLYLSTHTVNLVMSWDNGFLLYAWSVILLCMRYYQDKGVTNVPISI